MADIPAGFHCPSSARLQINQEAVKYELFTAAEHYLSSPFYFASL